MPGKPALKRLIPLLSLFCLFAFCGCDKRTEQPRLNGKLLLEQKCAECHNLAMPPVTSAKEKAPPMMAVAFHVNDFIPVATPAERTSASIAFVVDYALEPSESKAFCDEESLKSYGLMPSMKGRVTEAELEAIAAYIFRHYTKEYYLEQMQAQAAFNRLPEGERIARRQGCLNCHDTERFRVGPSLMRLSEHFKGRADAMAKSIREGSRDRWEQARRVPMPAFAHLDDVQMQTLTAWILQR